MKRKLLNTAAALLFIVGLYCFFGYISEIGMACVKLGTENCARALAE